MALTVMVIQKAGRWRTVTLGNRRSLSTILLARSMTLGAMVVLVVLGALVPTAVRAESTYAYDAQPLSCVDTRVIDSGVDVSPQVTALQVGSASPLAATRGTSTTHIAPVVATNTANGGAATVRVGQAGEAAVRGAYDIGPKATAVVNGRARIFDGLNGVAVTEVKNVGYQAYTQQLKDSLAYAQQNGLQFDLFVRGGASPTVLSGPLQDAIVSTPGFNVRFIP